ncbi:hypothetical protein, partial [Wolbachia endosymbiont of Nomada ferruginata]
MTIVRVSFQCSFLVIRVADTGIQKKEWCHPSTPFSSSQCLFLCHPSAQTLVPFMTVSFQCLTLESSLYYAATYLKLRSLDPSVK